jgi:hypothetical protein
MSISEICEIILYVWGFFAFVFIIWAVTLG